MKKKVILAFDSFKGSLSSRQAGEAAAKGVRDVYPDWDCEVLPLGDGGEGTADILKETLGGENWHCTVSDPLGRSINADFVGAGDIAIIEVASASGLTLLKPNERNPLITSSYGTGQLIAESIRNGFRKIFICLGGSATNDGGVGLLSALGYRFLDANGCVVEVGGQNLHEIISINTDNVIPELKDCEFTAVCDVFNPLLGYDGASRVFGPQKGATSQMVESLERNMEIFSKNVTRWNGGRDYSMTPGAGAAGGIGFAILSFLNGRIVSGIDTILNIIGFDEKAKEADFIFTGEGRIDVQTSMGKAPGGVLRRAKALGKPVIGVGGCVDRAAIPSLMDSGFKAVFPIVSGPITLEEAMNPELAQENLRGIISQIVRLL